MFLSLQLPIMNTFVVSAFCYWKSTTPKTASVAVKQIAYSFKYKSPEHCAVLGHQG